MVGIQLGLIDVETGVAIVPAEEIHSEDSYSFRQMTEIARNFGLVKGRLLRLGHISQDKLDGLIIGFVDGLDACRELSADEREWLRNSAFTASQAWTEPS